MSRSSCCCCCCSVARLCRVLNRLCHPLDCSTTGFLVLHCLPEFAQIHVHWVSDAIWSSYPLLPSSPFAFNISQNQDFNPEICPELVHSPPVVLVQAKLGTCCAIVLYLMLKLYSPTSFFWLCLWKYSQLLLGHSLFHQPVTIFTGLLSNTGHCFGHLQCCETKVLIYIERRVRLFLNSLHYCTWQAFFPPKVTGILLK